MKSLRIHKYFSQIRQLLETNDSLKRTNSSCKAEIGKFDLRSDMLY